MVATANNRNAFLAGPAGESVRVIVRILRVVVRGEMDG